MEKLKAGDILIAEHYCGFPDETTKGNEYEVSRTEEMSDGRIMFYIIADDGKERLPISTTFKRKYHPANQ